MKAYLAGPEVFLRNAREQAAKKVAICAKFGLSGCPPLNEDIAELTRLGNSEAWRMIFRKYLAMMEECDIIIANLTPFGGASADSGTLVELGWFLGRGKPVFGYSNSGIGFETRMTRHLQSLEPKIAGIAVESFGLPDNLMIAGAVQSGGYPIILPRDGIERGIDALDVFENCVAIVAQSSELP